MKAEVPINNRLANSAHPKLIASNSGVTRINAMSNLMNKLSLGRCCLKWSNRDINNKCPAKANEPKPKEPICVRNGKFGQINSAPRPRLAMNVQAVKKIMLR